MIPVYDITGRFSPALRWLRNLGLRLGSVNRESPSAWEGETVGRFAFVHPHTSMDPVRQVLDRME